MTQLTFAEAEYANKKHKTRRELFLEKMNKLIPWAKLEKKIARYYPKAENGRPPYPLSTMQRVHSLQLFYNLSDQLWEMDYTKLNPCVNLPVCGYPSGYLMKPPF